METQKVWHGKRQNIDNYGTNNDKNTDKCNTTHNENMNNYYTNIIYIDNYAPTVMEIQTLCHYCK